MTRPKADTGKGRVLAFLERHRGRWVGGWRELGPLYHKFSTRVSELKADGWQIERRKHGKEAQYRLGGEA